jgi:soluble lytic murein transglycosylase-like protein
LVAEAYSLGAKAKLDPTLILAIMAIESGFNPFAQSPVGAQGLMQVMTKIHSDKYEDFGGKLAAFDPITNLRVGVKVLQGCIAQAGSIEGGLKYYVGAANLADDGGYANKVVAEYARLYQVAYGKAPPQRQLTPNTDPSMVRANTPKTDSLNSVHPVVLPVIAPAKPAEESVVEKIAAL